MLSLFRAIKTFKRENDQRKQQKLKIYFFTIYCVRFLFFLIKMSTSVIRISTTKHYVGYDYEKRYISLIL